MQKNLQVILKGKVVIVGMGNALRGDDAVGPDLIAGLKGKVSVVCIDAGTSPENYVGKIAREAPDTVLLVDALHLGGAPGEYDLLRKEELVNSGLSTHDFSPRMFIEYLESRTRAAIYLLGIQPKTLGLGQEMSPEVKQALGQISTLIQDRFPNQSRMKILFKKFFGMPKLRYLRNSTFGIGNCPQPNPECRNSGRVSSGCRRTSSANFFIRHRETVP